jgi:hypothetical protein
MGHELDRHDDSSSIADIRLKQARGVLHTLLHRCRYTLRWNMRGTRVERSMNQALTKQVLRLETSRFLGTGGESSGNRSDGFRPAFLDTDANTIYLSRFGNGQPAPFHLLDGLPDELVLQRSASGRVEAVKPTVVSGFVRAGRFYSREEAAQAVAEIH